MGADCIPGDWAVGLCSCGHCCPVDASDSCLSLPSAVSWVDCNEACILCLHYLGVLWYHTFLLGPCCRIGIHFPYEEGAGRNHHCRYCSPQKWTSWQKWQDDLQQWGCWICIMTLIVFYFLCIFFQLYLQTNVVCNENSIEFDMISNVIDCFLVSIWFLPYVGDFSPNLLSQNILPLLTASKTNFSKKIIILTFSFQ